MIDKIKLIDSALEAQLKAICPYSNYPVGAALLSDDNNALREWPSSPHYLKDILTLSQCQL